MPQKRNGSCTAQVVWLKLAGKRVQHHFMECKLLFQNSKFREVLFICPICVYGPILLAGGVNMRLRCIKKKIVRHERILGNLTTHVRKTHLPTFTMNAGNHRKKIVHVARSIFCVICVFNVFWVAGTLISLFSVK